MEVYQLSKKAERYIHSDRGDTNVLFIKVIDPFSGHNKKISFGWYNKTYYNGSISSWEEHFFEPIKKEYIFIKKCNYIKGNISDLMIRPGLPNGGSYGDIYLRNKDYSLSSYIRSNNIDKNLPFIGIFAEKNNIKANYTTYELNLIISGVGIVTLDIGLHNYVMVTDSLGLGNYIPSVSKIYKGLKIKNNK